MHLVNDVRTINFICLQQQQQQTKKVCEFLFQISLSTIANQMIIQTSDEWMNNNIFCVVILPPFSILLELSK